MPDQTRKIIEDAYQVSLLPEALNDNHPDPLLVARTLPDDAALICALFSYGGFRNIVRFLKTLPFELLDESDQRIQTELNHYYRFQTKQDVMDIFLGFAKLRRERILLKTVFEDAYQKDGFLYGLNTLIGVIREAIRSDSHGVQFFANRTFNPHKITGVSANKRYMMYLRWMIRKSAPDFGRWQADTADLIMPLDTHTFRVGTKLGLISRKVADLRAAIELTESLKKLDAKDPLKYDFALYRLGQSGF